MTMEHSHWGLPDPYTEAELYDAIPTKRLIAWVVDVVLIGIITAVVLPFTFFTGLFFLPLLFGVISFIYRWSALARHSATPGMRFVAIELRGSHGGRLDGTEAFLHTLGYVVSVVTFPLQLISIALMLATPRRQGLTDHVLGTAAINQMRQ